MRRDEGLAKFSSRLADDGWFSTRRAFHSTGTGMSFTRSCVDWWKGKGERGTSRTGFVRIGP